MTTKTRITPEGVYNHIANAVGAMLHLDYRFTQSSMGEACSAGCFLPCVTLSDGTLAPSDMSKVFDAFNFDEIECIFSGVIDLRVVDTHDRRPR